MTNGDEHERSALDEEIEAGIALFNRPWTFVLGVVRLDQLPDADRPEIAFAGRSNVGKSSLINALVGRRALARTSNTPGRTQELNFFTADIPLYIVDLPGYGYAKAPKERVTVWTKLTRRYLVGRPNLARAFLLIDARHGLKANDLETMAALNSAAVSFQVVLTKIDKLKPSDRQPVIDRTLQALAREPAAHPEVLATSSVTGDGLDPLKGAIARVMIQAGFPAAQ